MPDEYASFVEAERNPAQPHVTLPERVPEATVAIRSATRLDASIVANVYLRSRRTHVRCAPVAHPDDDVLRWVRDVLLPGGTTRVATIAGGVVGMIATAREDGIDARST